MIASVLGMGSSVIMMDEDVEEGVPASDAMAEIDATNSNKTTTTDGQSDAKTTARNSTDEPDWDHDPTNPLNWSAWKKTLQTISTSSLAFVASLATSIVAPAHAQLMQEFNANSTAALVPLALYVFALGFGPVMGGPLSETFGRRPIYLLNMPLGALFTLGAGFTHSFGALCFLRFMTGFCWAPLLAVPSATVSETFEPRSRGPISALFILIPFLGPGLG
ncbi:Benomyl/methotrexate resistance protein [Tolypocladium capitatum]|uniref:Benomyl/methotrexate resistance protein n=1 Tax=Tolypocladium capitatum TaxID=45235 RepID=A0A2K3Q0K9_9HYPO|nr:Benomyl/methotrexate resistance protein [Tolypocladium capitatum]